MTLTAELSSSTVLSPFLPGTNIQFAEAKRIVNRLLDKAIRSGECLECHLAPVPKGYCYVQVGGKAGEKWRVHRLVWAVTKGPIPSGLLVLHSCDNRRCIEIEHLSIGTEADNTQDMMNKGRHKFILPNRQIANPTQIRQLRAEGLTYEQIGQRLEISASTACNYCAGEYRNR